MISWRYSSEKYLRKSIELRMSPSEVFWSEVKELHRLGRNRQAIKLCDKVLKVDPKDYAALNNKAACLESRGKLDEALKYYCKALKVNPESDIVQLNTIGIYYHQGKKLIKQGKYDKAIKCLNKALEINPYKEDVMDLREIAWKKKTSS